MSKSCKVCELLATLSPASAKEINHDILERSVSAEFAAATFTKHVGSVGASTVKKHRKEYHV